MNDYKLTSCAHLCYCYIDTTIGGRFGKHRSGIAGRWRSMTHAWHQTHQPGRDDALEQALARLRSARLDDRCGGVGGSVVLRAIRAVSSASRARGLAL